MKDFLSHLNKEQYEAATTINGPLLIIAGAGSGKTMTLVSRIANMIDEGIDPESILLLTFTNKAAKEMARRIVKNIGSTAENVTASTFHSFCAMLLRKYSHIIGLKNNFTIIDSVDATEVMGIARDDFIIEQKSFGVSYNAKDFPDKKVLLEIYSRAVNNCVDVKTVICNAGYSHYCNDVNAIINKYIKYKNVHMLVDYDDLLDKIHKILVSFENIRKSIGDKYKYVCCDEYQDTNILQDKILDAICRDHQNLAVVGDENQSIYKFRGAEIENILTFSKRHPGCKTIILNQNYRSSQEILDLSNAMMKYANEGTKKVLCGQFNGPKPHLMVTNTDDEECHRIAAEIKRHHSMGTPLKEMAVIARSSSQTFKLEAILNVTGVPFNKFGGLKFLDRTVVRDIISFLRVIVNEKDEIALYRILQLYPGIGKGYSGKITEAVTKDGLWVLPDLFPKTAFNKYLLELYNIIEKINDKSLDEQLLFLLEDYYPKTVERSINVSKLNEGKKLEEIKKLYDGVELAKALCQMTKGYKTTKKFLEDITLEATSPNDEDDKLNITTIHSAKGLEYDIVFVMDVIENITPKCKKFDEEENEELRCLYVALTRARKELYVFVPKSHFSQPFVVFNAEMSRFINYDDVLECFELPPYDISVVRKNYKEKFW